MARPLLLLVPPLPAMPDAPPAAAALERLVRAVRGQRQAGRDLRLRVCRARTADAEADAAARSGAVLAVVSLASRGRADVAAQALHAALLARAAGRTHAGVIAADHLDAVHRLAADAGAVTVDGYALDLGSAAPGQQPALRPFAGDALRRAHVALVAEMFAGNHIEARHAALIECIVP